MKKILSAAVIAIAAFSTQALADNQWYVGGTISYLNQVDSSNNGTTGDFNTGNGSPVVPNGTPISAMELINA